MSFRKVQGNSVPARTFSFEGEPAPPWTRNKAWPTLTPPTSGEQKLVGLHAVWPGDGVGNGGNFFAVTCAADYTVDFGDGTSVNKASGVQTDYEYNFADGDLYDATVTLTDSGDTVNRTAHGYIDGDIVQFYRIASTTGLTEAQSYFVINASANSFQVSLTQGGSAVALTTDGSASLLPYKIATVVITPQAGQNITSINLFVRHSQTGLQAYSTGWLDIAIAGTNITSLIISGSSTTSNVNHTRLERFAIVSLGAVTSFADLLRNCVRLGSVDIASSSSVGSMGNMFNACSFLTTVSLSDTAAVTNMNGMFTGCYSLRGIPLFNTAAVTNMNNMFSNCAFLTTVPLFNTAAVTTMNAMFTGCSSLKTVPLFNTSAVTDMGNMFFSCPSLTTVPLFNTAAVTNMSGMFSTCPSLTTVPLFDTAAVTNMNSMFTSCTSLATVPLFNTAAVTNIGGMFSGCRSLKKVPLFNTAAATDMSTMFTGCFSLITVPLFNTAAATGMGGMFNNCTSLVTVPLFNTAAVTNMNSMFANCTSLAAVPLFNTAAATSMNSMFSNCRSLSAIPPFNVSAVSSSSNFGAMFGICPSIRRIEAKNFRFSFAVASCLLSKAALEEIFANLPTVSTAQTITITNNYGIGTSVTARSTTRTAQSTTSTLADTTSLANGMLVIGTGTGISTGITVVSDVSADTLTLTNHGLPDGTPVAFSSLGTTTGVSLWTIYYVVSTAANTFQVATTIGGAAIDLTGTGGNMVVRYANYITNIVANTSITTSTPMATTGTGNLDYRTIDTATAMLKNWAVTY